MRVSRRVRGISLYTLARDTTKPNPPPRGKLRRCNLVRSSPSLNELKHDFLEIKFLKSEDIEAVEQKDKSGLSIYIIHSKTNNTYLIMNALFYKIFSMMNGRLTLLQIIGQVCPGDNQPTYQTLYEFLAFLLNNGLILHNPGADEIRIFTDNTKTKDYSIQSTLFRIGRWIIKSKLEIPNADRFVARLYSIVGWVLFRRFFIFVQLMLLGLAASLFLKQISKIVSIIIEMVFTGNFTVIHATSLYIGIAASIALHELAHALTCKHFGRKVQSFGLMIYYGFLTFYTDVTDSWMLPKRRRMMVAGAGALTNIMVGAICSVIAFIIPSESLFRVFMILAIVNFITAVFNLIPFLKFDGYYLLSDILDKPSLREDSLILLSNFQNWKNLLCNSQPNDMSKGIFIFGLCSLFFGVITLGFGGIGLFLFIHKFVPEPYNNIFAPLVIAALSISILHYAMERIKTIKQNTWL